jgi:hypothetical protein
MRRSLQQVCSTLVSGSKLTCWRVIEEPRESLSRTRGSTPLIAAAAIAAPWAEESIALVTPTWLKDGALLATARLLGISQMSAWPSTVMLIKRMRYWSGPSVSGDGLRKG